MIVFIGEVNVARHCHATNAYRSEHTQEFIKVAAMIHSFANETCFLSRLAWLRWLRRGGGLSRFGYLVRHFCLLLLTWDNSTFGRRLRNNLGVSTCRGLFFSLRHNRFLLHRRDRFSASSWGWWTRHTLPTSRRHAVGCLHRLDVLRHRGRVPSPSSYREAPC